MTSHIGELSIKQFSSSLLTKIIIIVVFLMVTAGAAYFVFTQVREQVANSDILPDVTLKNAPKKSGEEQNSESTTQDPAHWREQVGTDRVTVLILGIDERAQEEDIWRTDTMMLATFDPVTMQAGVLSIPRDLWVHIPGYTEDRINKAHFLGDAYDHPGGGPALAVQTVEYNLGVEIDYYVRFNFQAFIDIVDLIGGITVDVPERIEDSCYPTPDYGCEHLVIEAGEQHFYGDMALKYARVRHTEGGDFDRARRQQQVVRAIVRQVTTLNKLPQLAARAPEIYSTIEDSVKIDPNLQLDKIIALAFLASEIDPDDIRFRVIDEQCTLFKVTPDEMMILIPLRDKVRAVRDEVFGFNTHNGDIKTVEEEAATISVLNGTETPGLASSTTEFLSANGIPITAYDNADRQDYDTSLVILNTDKPMTALQLLSLLRLPESVIVNGSNPSAEYDIVVILGEDYAAQQTTAPYEP